MHDKCCVNFQEAVDEYLIRHRSVLDVLTKYHESAARVNRAVAKAVTDCGCIEISAVRQKYPHDAEYGELKNYVSSHVKGEPCGQCREVLLKEMGHNLFYLAALCNLTGLKLHDVMMEEHKNVTTLGMFHLS